MLPHCGHVLILLHISSPDKNQVPAGTEAGEKQIPESLGLAPGLVFLICLIVFQQLQSYDFRAITERLYGSSDTQKQAWVSPLSYRCPNQITARLSRWMLEGCLKCSCLQDPQAHHSALASDMQLPRSTAAFKREQVSRNSAAGV